LLKYSFYRKFRSFFNVFWFALNEEGTQKRIAIINQILKELNGI